MACCKSMSIKAPTSSMLDDKHPYFVEPGPRGTLRGGTKIFGLGGLPGGVSNMVGVFAAVGVLYLILRKKK